MAKYLDQTGAQHFAEAIMGSTKTINGQPIWGSGNIEAGDGGNIITLKSATDFDTYSSLLADDGYKVVIFAFNSVTLSDKTYTIRNAKIYANYNGRYNPQVSNCQITFQNCSSIYYGPTATYTNVFPNFKNSTVNIIQCRFHWFYSSNIASQGAFSGSILNITQSYVSVEMIQQTPTLASIVLTQSTIEGFFISSTVVCSNYVSGSTRYLPVYPPIINKCINCILSNVTSTVISQDIIDNTIFENCSLLNVGDGIKVITNTINCKIKADSAAKFFGLNSFIVGIDSDHTLNNLKQWLDSDERKTVIFTEESYNISGGDYIISNADIYCLADQCTFSGTKDTGGTISGTITFKNCKTIPNRATNQYPRIVFNELNLITYQGELNLSIVESESATINNSFIACNVDIHNGKINLLQYNDTFAKGGNNEGVTIRGGVSESSFNLYSSEISGAYFDELSSIKFFSNYTCYGTVTYTPRVNRCFMCDFKDVAYSNFDNQDLDNYPAFVEWGTFSTVFDQCIMPPLTGAPKTKYIEGCENCLISPDSIGHYFYGGMFMTTENHGNNNIFTLPY